MISLKEKAPTSQENIEEKAQAIAEQYDPSARFRKLPKLLALGTSIIAIGWSLFQLYTAAFGSLDAIAQRAVHLTFALVLVFLLCPQSKNADRKRIPLYDYILVLLAITVGQYLVFNMKEIFFRVGIVTKTDIFMGVSAIFLVLEACRRMVGRPLAIIAIVCLLYGYFGYLIPGYFGHMGFSFKRIVGHMYISTEGIFGVPLGVSSTYIFLFVLFGSFLFRTGVGQLFIDLALSLAGHQPGGPAKVAIIASGMLGTINGTTVGNVLGTGVFTIPLMKKVGYKPYFAGAVEAAASTGGQLMPPVMGAAAFVMAEFTGIPYLRIALAAAIPALLYYLAIIVQVHLEAKKEGLVGLSKESLPLAIQLLKTKGHLLTPVAVILFLLIKGYTPTFAAFYGTLSTILVAAISPKTRLSIKKILEALEAGAKDAIGIAVACSTVGLIIGTATMTGLGGKLAGGIINFAGGNLLLTMILTMIASLILGMGLPTTANYIITSTMAAPALVKLGIPVLAAHMFCFYYGIIADITPPVALGAMAASSLAGSEPFKTGVTATKLGIVSFIVPYFFVLSPELLMIDSTVTSVLIAAITSIIGVVALGAGLEGYFLTNISWWERLFAIAGGVLLVKPGLTTDIIGFCLLAFILIKQIADRKKSVISSSAAIAK